MRSRAEVEIFMRHVLNELELRRTVYSEPFPSWAKPFQGYAKSEADNNFRRHV